MTRLEVAKRAIHFQNPPYIPMFRYDHLHRADLVRIPVENHFGGPKKLLSEWGFEWEEQEGLEFYMGQTKTPVITDWDLLGSYNPAPISADPHRFDYADKVMKEYPDRYYMADFQLSGFTITSFIRGFEDLLMDFYLEPKNVEALLDIVFEREAELIRACAAKGFHGISFWDDMGSQQNLLFSPEIFRKFFKPRFKKQFDLVHSLGMDVFMHSCGYVFDLIPEFIDVGLDIMNCGQPALNGIERMGREFGNDVCFCLPVGYQTTAVNGTLKDVEDELLKYIECFAQKSGGYIAYTLHSGYAGAFGAEKEQKIHEIYDKHCGRD